MEKIFTLIITIALAGSLGNGYNITTGTEKLIVEIGKNGSFTIAPKVDLQEMALVELFNDKYDIASIPSEVS